jgi:GNAT superfamily N-acetyltransferase
VFVEPRAARQGIGRRIMSAVESAMRAELGATRSGYAFYRSLGYQPLDELRVDLGGGVAMHFTRMRKPLTPANSDHAVPSLMTG